MKTGFRVKALALAFCLAGTGSAMAAEGADQTLTVQSATMDRLTTTQGSTRVTTRFADDFATFAGSQENAEAILTGLRTGTPITLSGTATTTGGGAATVITPPTRPMGYGETYISMSLAKAQLAQYGITDPTPEELQAALTGGAITVTTVGATGTSTTQTVTLEGILTQRASGMGWGQIASANGFKLGPVISGMKSANKSLALATRTQTASGAPAATTGTAKARATYGGKGGYASSDPGITTALGGGGVVYGKSHARAGTRTASLNSQGASGIAHGGGAGIATAAGGSAALHGNAGGNSGNAAGHGRGPQ